MPISKRKATAVALAVAIAAPAEGLRRIAYYDPPGILTVCRGHTGLDVVKGRVYSLKECDAFMDADMKKAVETVDSCVPGLPENVLAAFADATYNMGPTIACDTQHSTAARLLRAGQLTGACNQLPRWNKAKVGGVMVVLPGLAKRREAERELCLKGLT
jgi:GH24 family phage-related lysozyme (muramidase)